MKSDRAAPAVRTFLIKARRLMKDLDERERTILYSIRFAVSANDRTRLARSAAVTRGGGAREDEGGRGRRLIYFRPLEPRDRQIKFGHLFTRTVYCARRASYRKRPTAKMRADVSRFRDILQICGRVHAQSN